MPRRRLGSGGNSEQDQRNGDNKYKNKKAGMKEIAAIADGFLRLTIAVKQRFGFGYMPSLCPPKAVQEYGDGRLSKKNRQSWLKTFVLIALFGFGLLQSCLVQAGNYQVSAGDYQSCVLDDNGVACWGDNTWGQSTAPALSNPIQVSTGARHACALDDSGVVCWGYDRYGETNVPGNLSFTGSIAATLDRDQDTVPDISDNSEYTQCRPARW